ncbi:hypothetical protein [Schaalia cardiffensis]|uniref:hypothetical protein n=1 Tax=Schaalia cardiffensis TaxID=181487 RepID=UPI002AB26FF6|nr:hypothetical protein [Schaalia cardiffensis]
MSSTTRTVKVSSLRLDSQNPRLGEEIASQESIFAELLSTDAKVRELATLALSIVKLGGLDPSQLPVVVEEGSELVVIEGNRRIAALKLLLRPSLAPNEKLKRRFSEIAKEGSISPSVRIVQFDSRSKYDSYLVLRHTGENKGAGLKPWRSADIARFQERQGKSRSIHTELIAWCRAEFADDEEMLKLVGTIEQGYLTTLKRFLMKVIRDRLGLRWTEGKLSVEYSAAQLRPFLKRLFVDLTGKMPNDQPWSRARQENVLAYVYETHPDLLPSEEEKAQPEPEPVAARPDEKNSSAPAAKEEVDPRSASPSTSSDEKTQNQANAGSAPQTPTAILEGLDLSVFGQRINNIHIQAQRLRVAASPDLCGIALRVILELCVDEFCKQTSVQRATILSDTVLNVIQTIDPAATKGGNAQGNPLTPIYRDYKRNGTDRGYAADRIHDFVHSSTRVVTAGEVLRESQQLSALLVAMSEYLRNTQNP